jgi:hypothetical protein
MKKSFFEKVLNKTNKQDIDQWFGENSEIKVTEFSHSISQKKNILSVTLYPTNYEYAIELFPEGLEILILHTIKSLSLPEDYILTTSIEH